MTAEAFRAELHTAVAEFSRTRPINEEVWATFARSIDYVATPDDSSYDQLREVLARTDAEIGANGNRLFYLATPPGAYEPIIRAIGAHGLRGESGWSRVVVEKPYGHDLQSAMQLTSVVQEVFREDEVFRIDHYLGKETVQNILVLRFANSIFEPIWKRQYVDHVQITAAESIGIEERAGYYDSVGAMRDIVQNHLLQLLALVGMEPPAAFDDRSVRDEKVKVLRALRRITPEEVGALTVRGQYGPGFIGGEPVPGYREEHGSRTIRRPRRSSRSSASSTTGAGRAHLSTSARESGCPSARRRSRSASASRHIASSRAKRRRDSRRTSW